ncbi:MAG: transcriptional repressor LexA [Hydrococcus sp. Prado102]|jgi:repressor LexA|nr:transcriptional repressor LexA [Hydrococcus sp. Prado102]
MEPLTQAQQELYDWLVEYTTSTQHAPSIRQMMRAMNLRSPAPIQSRLERLRVKGYIDWTDGKARTLRVLHRQNQGIPVLGAIAAGGLVEPFTDVQDKLDFSTVFQRPNCFALRVVGDSMIEDLIAEGDMVVMRSVIPNETIKNGEIVAARVDGYGTTLKRFYQTGNKIALKPSNRKYAPIEVRAEQVDIQGILVGVWRGY